MKKIINPALLFIGIAAACNPAADQQKRSVSTAETVMNVKEKKVDSTKLLIAGKQAGHIYLGQDMKTVSELLGRPDGGDAAMGSELGIWNKKEPLIIFSSYRDSNMVIKDVKQISVSSGSFSTAEGIRTGVSLTVLKKTYPDLKKAASYTRKEAKLTVYDVASKGIAFDVQNDTCTAITIHPVNKSVNEAYLTMYPDWKKS